MKSPFDTPNKKSLLQAKEHWEDCLALAKQDPINEEDIAIAEENLKNF